jgi:hypothetical protein
MKFTTPNNCRKRVKQQVLKSNVYTNKNKFVNQGNGAYSFLRYTTVKINKKAFLKKRKAIRVVPYDTRIASPPKRRRKRSFNVDTTDSGNDYCKINQATTVKPSAPPMVKVHRKNEKFHPLLNMFRHALDKEMLLLKKQTNNAVIRIANRLSAVQRKYAFLINSHRSKRRRRMPTQKPILIMGKVVRRGR